MLAIAAVNRWSSFELGDPGLLLADQAVELSLDLLADPERESPPVRVEGLRGVELTAPAA